MKKLFAIIIGLLFVPGAVFADQTITTTGSNTGNDAFGYTTFKYNAQSIDVDITGTISQIQANIGSNNSPADGVQLVIQADSGGAPSGTPLGTSDTVAAGDITACAAGGRETFNFSSAVSVSPGTYWIVYQRTGSLSGANWYEECGASGNPYAGGNQAQSNGAGASWTNDSDWDSNLTLTIVETGGGEESGQSGGGATSTIDQIHKNLFNGFVIFFGSMVFMIWVFRRPRI